MKKFIFFILGISAMLLGGCSNGNQNHSEVVVEDSTPCCPPLGYVIELQPLGDFSHQKAELLREELVKQLATIFRTNTKAELEASISVAESKPIPTSFSISQGTDIGLEKSWKYFMPSMEAIMKLKFPTPFISVFY